MNTFRLFFLGLVMITLLFGCSANSQSVQQKEGVTIYTSIYPIQYLVERIGGDSLEAKTVFPPGVDAHSYEPTAKDMIAIARSDAFIYIGHEMEGFSETLASAVETEDVRLFSLGEHEELFENNHENELEHEGHHHGDHDPHIWLDPLRMVQMGHIIMDDLIQINPGRKEYYQSNFASLKKDLTELDNEFSETLHQNKNKEILVSHAAYGFWEDRYGIKQLAINGLSSSSEPSQKDLVTILKQAEESGLHYVIFEQNTSNNVAEIIQNELGAEALTIHNLEVLTEKDIRNKEDYLSLMRRNLRVLDKATK